MTCARRLPRVVLVELAGDGEAVVLARALRDAGIEVVYAGRLPTWTQVASTVEQEDPDALGLACDAGTDPALLARVAAAVPGVRLFGWGSVPADALEWVFDEATEVTEWLRLYWQRGGEPPPPPGGAIHTPEAAPDRAR